MPLKVQELGERVHVDLRTGESGLKWRGVNREGDPAAIDLDQFYYLQNARLVGGEYIPRGGQAAVNTTPVEGCLDWFFDAGDTGAAEDEALSDGVTAQCGVGYGEWVSSRLYNFSATYDSTNGLKAASGVSGTSRFTYLDSANERILIGAGSAIYSLRKNSATVNLVCTTTLPVMSIVKFGSTYYIGCGSGTSSHVALWDGAATTPASTEQPDTLARFPFVCADATDVYVIYGGGSNGVNTTTNTFYRRNSGTWTNVTAPVNDFMVVGARTRSGTLYIYGTQKDTISSANWVGTVWTYGALTITAARNFGAGTNAVSAVMNGTDFYLIWSDTTGGGQGTFVAQYNGAWTNTFGTLDGASPSNWRFLDVYSSEIYLIGVTTLYRTTSADLSAALTTVSTLGCYGFGGFFDFHGVTY